MSEQIELTNPVTIKSDSDARVAYDLMKLISYSDENNNELNSNPKKYYINLYVDCLEAVKHGKRHS